MCMQTQGTCTQADRRHDSAKVKPKSSSPDSIIWLYLQRFLMEFNTSHTLFLVTKGSATLQTHPQAGQKGTSATEGKKLP